MPDARRALVTGATGAIGQAIACRLAAAGCQTVLVARNPRKAERSLEALRRAATGPQPRVEMADLAQRDQIEALAQRWQGPLDILVNNAALAPRLRQESPEGVEMQWAVNVLSYDRMLRAFRPALARADAARVVLVASYWAGGLDLQDPEFQRRPYDNDQAYRQAKQADRMLAAAWAERLTDKGIAVNACHPGDVPSRLAGDLGFGGGDTPDQAAATPARLALGEIGPDATGRYFEHGREKNCRFCRDRQAVETLFECVAAYST